MDENIRFLEAILASPTRWIVSDEEASHSPPLLSLGGATLISPAWLSDAAGTFQGPAADLFPLPEGDLWVSCTRLVVALPEGSACSQEEIRDGLIVLLDKLRVYSGQAALRSTNIIATVRIGDYPVKKPKVEKWKLELNLEFNKTLLHQVMRFDELPAADVMEKSIHFVSREIYADAIEACYVRDWRRAVLYAAMSLEVGIKEKVEATYEALRKKAEAGEPLPEHRFQRIQVVTDEVTWKDPVYTALRRAAGEGGELRRLFHETSLYLTGRSLQLEDNSLYRDAAKLYRTRNRIVHDGGAGSESDEVFTIDPKGAMEAVDTAWRVFKWLGEDFPPLLA